MDLLVILVAFGVLGFLALCFGYDSRAKIQSKEEELACLGMTWEQPGTRVPDLRREAAARRLVRLASAPRKQLGSAAARALVALANWLSPELRDDPRYAGRRISAYWLRPELRDDPRYAGRFAR